MKNPFKKIIRIYRFKRYQREFRKPFYLYAGQTNDPSTAIEYACTAFEWFYGFSYQKIYDELNQKKSVLDYA